MLQPDIASAQGGHVQGKQRRLTEERLPPYLSYRVWQRLLNELSAHNPPSRFDSSYFDELKITKSCRSMLKGTLLFLDLMSTDGIPTTQITSVGQVGRRCETSSPSGNCAECLWTPVH